MVKERSGYVFEENKKWCARLTFTDESRQRRNIKRRAENKSEAKTILSRTCIISIMDEKILIPIFSLGSAVIGGVIASWANWGVEKRKQKLTYRKELICSWRKMLEDIAQIHHGHEKTLGELLELKAEFYSLKPHLRSSVIDLIGGMSNTSTGTMSTQIQKYEHRNLAESEKPIWKTEVFRFLIDEIADIEKKWGLV